MSIDHEQQIRDLMRKFGLTRGEAEGLLNSSSENNNQVRENPEDLVFWRVVAVLAGLFGLAFVDWLLKRLRRT